MAIWATWKLNGVASIRSRPLGRIITKIVLYPLAIIVAKVAHDYLAPSIPWTDVTAGIIATVEIKSIFEKMSLILGFNLWKKIKKAIKSVENLINHLDYFMGGSKQFKQVLQDDVKPLVDILKELGQDQVKHDVDLIRKFRKTLKKK